MSEGKICNRCKAFKTRDEFPALRVSADFKGPRCRPCGAEVSKAYRLKNPDKVRKNNKAFALRNPDYAKNWGRANKERRSQQARDWYIQNRDRKVENNRKWKIENPEKNLAYRKKRAVQERLATPVYADKKSMRKFKNRVPDDCAVDHIIPLIHKDVCGLNTLENLQYLTLYENAVKGISFDGTIENNSWRRKLETKLE